MTVNYIFLRDVPDKLADLGLPKPALPTVYRWADSRKLRTYRVGGRILTTQADLVEFLGDALDLVKPEPKEHP